MVGWKRTLIVAEKLTYDGKIKLENHTQRNIIIWVNSLHFVELPETSTYEWKTIKKTSYLKLILI